MAAKPCAKCAGAIDRPGRVSLCSGCVRRPKWLSTACEECGQPFKGRARRFCDRECQRTSVNKRRDATSRTITVSEKPCTVCAVVKPSHMFNTCSGRKDGLASACRPCSIERQKGRANPARARDYKLRRAFGITADEYDALLAWQGGGCAMCGKPPPLSGRRHPVDHDHNTGAVRAILCHVCNKNRVGAQTLADARAVVAYLEVPPADQFFGSTRFVPEGMEKGAGRAVRRRRRKR